MEAALPRRFATVASIALLHVGLVYALQSGMARQVAKLPETVFATLIRTESAPPPSVKSTVLPKLAMPASPQISVPDVAVQAAPASPVSATIAARENATPATAAQAQPVAASMQPKTISTVEYLQAPQPEYPTMSRRMGEQGKVLLRILVNERGRAEQIDVQRSSGFPRLDEAARNAASRALFKPYIEDGRTMSVYVVVPIDFQLG